jgi:hypothetical protein
VDLNFLFELLQRLTAVSGISVFFYGHSPAHMRLSISQNFTKRLGVCAIIVALILLVPLVAMQLTDEVVWTLSDFVVAGVLLFGSVLEYELAARNASNAKNRVVVGLVVVAVFLWLWVELAVGIFTNWGS